MSTPPSGQQYELVDGDQQAFLLDVEVDYRLTSGELRSTTTATNRGESPCPYGCGQHPYLSAGNGPLDDCTLHAKTRIETDPTRQLPTGTEPVTGTPYDFRTARPIGDLRIDYAFTDLNRDPDGPTRVRLTRPDGSTVGLCLDSRYPLVEIFTGDTVAPDRARHHPLRLTPRGVAAAAAVSSRGLCFSPVSCLGHE